MESWWWFSFKSFFRSSVRPSVRSVSVGRFIQICRLETEKVKNEKKCGSFLDSKGRRGCEGKAGKKFQLTNFSQALAKNEGSNGNLIGNVDLWAAGSWLGSYKKVKIRMRHFWWFTITVQLFIGCPNKFWTEKKISKISSSRKKKCEFFCRKIRQIEGRKYVNKLSRIFGLLLFWDIFLLNSLFKTC